MKEQYENRYLAGKQMKHLDCAYYFACIEQADEHGIVHIDPEELTHWFAGTNRKAGRHIETLVKGGWLEHTPGTGMSFRVVSFDEHEYMRAKRNIRHGDRWGVWKLNASNLTLECDTPDSGGYYIDLEDITDAAEILDWLIHLQPHNKSWVTFEMHCDLLRAFQDIFQARSTFCGQNTNKCIDATAFVKWRLDKGEKPEHSKQ